MASYVKYNTAIEKLCNKLIDAFGTTDTWRAVITTDAPDTTTDSTLTDVTEIGNSNGYTTGDAANELAHLSLDPNVHIQEVKAFTCDVRPGRRPRGPERIAYVEEYRRRAGITEATGREP